MIKRIFLGLILTIGLFAYSSVSYANFPNPAASCAGVTFIPQSECEALLRFYNATDGDNWTDNTNRGNTGNSSWYGVSTFTNVLGLSLSYNNLSGVISSGILSDLPLLQTIDLEYNTITAIDSGAFAGLSVLGSLYLNNNAITTVDPNAFVGLANLRTLHLYDNQIASIATGTFRDISNLNNLYLNSNLLTSITPGMFSGLDNLVYLGLYSNQLTSIGTGAFSGLIDLTYLGLQANNITTIGPDSFIGLPALNYLELANNPLNTIPDNTFGPLSSVLNTLILNGTSLTTLTTGAFSGLNNLQYLYLGNNQLTNIDSDVFDFPSLGLLSLYNNNITTIASGAFSNLPSLNILNLYDNAITSIDVGDFAGLSALDSLSLYGNAITSIASGAFADVPLLHQLHLDGNTITSIDIGDFAGLSSLTDLMLYDNQISTIASGAFVGLSDLERLNIAYNNITSIDVGDFAGLSGLGDTLSLHGNAITTVADNAFADLSSAVTLYLSNNLLTGISNNTFNGLSGLQTLALDNNRIISLQNNMLTPLTSLTQIALDTNCLDQTTLDPGLVSALATSHNYSSRSNQKVCPTVSYSPSTTTSSPVVATIGWTGGNSADRTTLSTSNAATTHTFTTNGSYAFDLSTLNNSSLIRYTDITGAVTWIVPSVGGGGGGGGGGGSSTTIDNCPNGDYSPSYYDNLCGTAPVGSGTTTSGTVTGPSCGLVASGAGGCPAPTTNSGNTVVIIDEMTQAYNYAFAHGITTMPTIAQANMMGTLKRAHLAKMLSQYAAANTANEIDTSRTCEFPDIANQNAELQGFIKEACQRGLMGINIDNFNPNGEVTRAEFGTAFSRLLYGDVHNGGNPYYSNHLQALKDARIMNTISTPSMIEIRGYVMLMMMRAAQE